MEDGLEEIQMQKRRLEMEGFVYGILVGTASGPRTVAGWLDLD